MLAHITCKHCDEKFDMFELHKVRDNDTNALLTFEQAAEQFAELGCGALTAYGDVDHCRMPLKPKQA